MKEKYLYLLSALLIFGVVACSKKDDSPQTEHHALPAVSTAPIETTAVMTSTTAVTTTATTTTTAVTTTATTTTTETTSTTETTTTTFPFRRTAPVVTTTAIPVTTTAVPEIVDVPEPEPETEPETEIETEAISLVGLWEYDDYAGNRLEFYDSGMMIFWQEYSSVIDIEDGNLIMSGKTIPIEINGIVATAIDDDKTVLSMTAEPDSDMSTLQGKYSLNDCMIADSLRGNGQMIWIEDDNVYFGKYTSYSVEGRTLTIGGGAEAYNNSIDSDGTTLTITTGDGSEDTLVKLQ